MLIDNTSPSMSSTVTASGITYNNISKTTEFYVDKILLFNPLDIQLIQPVSNVQLVSDNEIRKFYSSYKKYVIDYSGKTYDIINYIEPNNKGLIKLRVIGNPFNNATGSKIGRAHV